MDDDRFWAMIEAAWASQSPDVLAERQALITRDPDGYGELGEDVESAIDDVIDVIQEELDGLSKADLLAFDRILERKLYDIDRAEIQAVTDGSDDGFLYCRGFIVAMGRAFYDAVNANPAMAICDAEAESMCYLSWHLYHEKFGELPPSKISRESGSNTDGWDE